MVTSIEVDFDNMIRLLPLLRPATKKFGKIETEITLHPLHIHESLVDLHVRDNQEDHNTLKRSFTTIELLEAAISAPFRERKVDQIESAFKRADELYEEFKEITKL